LEAVHRANLAFDSPLADMNTASLLNYNQ